eukprot:scaffold29236_cov120-Isochrysis_galbana.AAC.4
MEERGCEHHLVDVLMLHPTGRSAVRRIRPEGGDALAQSYQLLQRGLVGSVGHHPNRLKPDSQTELAKGQPAGCRRIELAGTDQVRETCLHAGENVGDQALIGPRPVWQQGQAHGVEHQPAKPQRIGGRPAIITLGEGQEDGCLLVEAGVFTRPAEPAEDRRSSSRPDPSVLRRPISAESAGRSPPPARSRGRNGADRSKGLRPVRALPILAVAVPFQALVVEFAGRPVRQKLTDPQSAGGRMALAFLLAQSAQPARARIVSPALAQNSMDLRDEAVGEIAPALLSGLSPERQRVHQRKGVGPQIALGLAVSGKPCAFGEIGHERHRLLCIALHRRVLSCVAPCGSRA